MAPGAEQGIDSPSESAGDGLDGTSAAIASNQTHHPIPMARPYIRTVYHPSSNRPEEICYLDAPVPSMDPSSNNLVTNFFAPFNCSADFDFASYVVQHRLSQQECKTLLKATLDGKWSNGPPKITYRNLGDLKKALDGAADMYGKFTNTSFTVPYRGESFKFVFSFRDVAPWIRELAEDRSLGDNIMWDAVRQYRSKDGAGEEKFVSELHTGDRWWEVQTAVQSFPGNVPDAQSIVLPVILYLDKTMVSRREAKWTVVCRPAFLPAHIRNSSGHYGALKIGYLPIIKDPLDPKEKDSDEYLRFRRTIYHTALDVMLSTCRIISKIGSLVKCGDGKSRVIYFSTHVYSMDLEEAYVLTLLRGPSSIFGVCPICHVPHNHQHNITGSSSWELRNSHHARTVYNEARSLLSHRGGVTMSNELLKNNGTYLIENALWDIENSDPFQAQAYDLLHSDDIGKIKRIMRSLRIKAIEMEQLGAIQENLSHVPSFPGLRVITNLDAVEAIAEGNYFLDLIRIILPCVVPALPRDDPLLLAIRALGETRILSSLNVFNDDRFHWLESAISRYGTASETAYTAAGGSTNFPKQHALSHLVSCIREKGAPKHYDTRHGEAEQANVKADYRMSSKKGNVNGQMIAREEHDYAIARIKASEEQFQAATTRDLVARVDDEDNNCPAISEPSDQRKAHHTFGSPAHSCRLAEYSLQIANNNGPLFRHFSKRLKGYISSLYPSVLIDEADMIHPHKACTVRYISEDDWTEQRDIIRCNPNFHGHLREDTVLIDGGPQGLRFARLKALFSLEKKYALATHEMALIRYFESSTPPTGYNIGMRSVKEGTTPTFVFLASVIRACHVIPQFGRSGHFWVNDLINGDLLLRLHN